jgi:hypothetical protein
MRADDEGFVNNPKAILRVLRLSETDLKPLFNIGFIERKNNGIIIKIGFIRAITLNIPSGKNHHNWKGGITPINKRIRKSIEYKQWVRTVFERDNYTCQICSKHGVKLNAHHIKPFAKHPELRLEISNGETLCEECHKKEHSGEI